MAPKKYDPSLVDLDKQLSAMSPSDRENAALAIEDKAKIIDCLSEKAPFSLVQKFVKRIGEVSELIESRFSAFEKARLAQAQGKTEIARELYKKIVGNPEAYNNLGIIAAEEGNMDEAKECWEKAVELGSLKALIGLGTLAYQEDRIHEAVEYYKRAAEAGISEANVNLGDMGRNNEMMQLLKKMTGGQGRIWWKEIIKKD